MAQPSPPAVYDCFPLFNELELLELRLEQHAPHVDHFVLGEATTTFSGKTKPLVYKENAARFRRFADKIIHVVIDDAPAGLSAWEREHFQRDALIRGLEGSRPDDVVLISDVDEILRHDALQRLAAAPLGRAEVRCFELRWYQFFFNLQLEEMWIRNGPRAARRRILRGMTDLRAVKGPVAGVGRDLARRLKASTRLRSWVRRTIEHDAGWHFSWIGDADRVAEKAGAIPPQVGIDATFAEKADALIADRAGAGREARDGVKIVPLDESFPAYLQQNADRLAAFLLPAP